jgi:hypothetical protein
MEPGDGPELKGSAPSRAVFGAPAEHFVLKSKLLIDNGSIMD